jgi:hypothetical protein
LLIIEDDSSKNYSRSEGFLFNYALGRIPVSSGQPVEQADDVDGRDRLFSPGVSPYIPPPSPPPTPPPAITTVDLTVGDSSNDGPAIAAVDYSSSLNPTTFPTMDLTAAATTSSSNKSVGSSSLDTLPVTDYSLPKEDEIKCSICYQHLEFEVPTQIPRRLSPKVV